MASFDYETQRIEHQPIKEPPLRSPVSPNELSCLLGRTVAVVLALEEGRDPLKVRFEDPEEAAVVCESSEEHGTVRPLQEYNGVPVLKHAIDLARESQIPRICVLADHAHDGFDEVSQIAREAGAELIERNLPTAVMRAKENAWFNVNDLPLGGI